MPIAKNENMTTERKTQGDKPEITANIISEITMAINFIKDPFRVFPIGFNIKVIKSIIKPTCSPDTERMCVAPEY
ncbi:hypothetical protein GCM10011518_06340 [Flavobacterium limi]|uniref:Uncharacterized protein n=1 Tax=Flavobacterium limi TaxID=2045105 RepID=A0ABQ1TN63_9FLAO|nr:hypothetical protein GCM10011518_06340 [Flavobacterium limi]